MCTTPCYLDLEHGEHLLQFRSARDPRRGETINLAVTPSDRTIGYRRDLGLHEPKVLRKIAGGAGLYVGTGGMVLAGLLYVIEANVGEGDYSEVNVLMIGSAALTAIGGYLLHTGKTVHRPGSGTRWEF